MIKGSNLFSKFINVSKSKNPPGVRLAEWHFVRSQVRELNIAKPTV